MNEVFDVIAAVNEKVQEFFERTGSKPQTISVSPALYRLLIEIRSWEHRIGNLIIGCAPVKVFESSLGTLAVVIDELFDEMHIEIS